jgi:hypothetical protein
VGNVTAQMGDIMIRFLKNILGLGKKHLRGTRRRIKPASSPTPPRWQVLCLREIVGHEQRPGPPAHR